MRLPALTECRLLIRFAELDLQNGELRKQVRRSYRFIAPVECIPWATAIEAGSVSLRTKNIGSEIVQLGHSLVIALRLDCGLAAWR